MFMEFPNKASTSVSLRGIFWLYACKDCSGASLTDLLDLAVLFHSTCNAITRMSQIISLRRVLLSKHSMTYQFLYIFFYTYLLIFTSLGIDLSQQGGNLYLWNSLAIVRDLNSCGLRPYTGVGGGV